MYRNRNKDIDIDIDINRYNQVKKELGTILTSLADGVLIRRSDDQFIRGVRTKEIPPR